MRAVRRTLLIAIAALALAGVAAAGASAVGGGVAKPVDVRAVRDGKTIRVTWRTARPAVDTSFEVAVQPLGTAPRDYARRDGDGGRRFSVTLRPTNPRAKRVTIYASNDRTMARANVTVTVR
jgi:hypothetical protein